MVLTNQIADLYQLIGDDKIRELGLFDIENGRLVTPMAADTLSLSAYRAKGPDEFVSGSVVEGLIKEMRARAQIWRLNHIGFCYKVGSREDEVERMAGVARDQGLAVYREASSDEGAWVFVGDISDLANPVLEFIPHEEPAHDKWVDTWLPHIQFDIDTGLAPDEITKVIRKYISSPYIPYPIRIEGITYIQRVRLGRLEGVNVFLDFSTNNRDADNAYRKSWGRLA